MAALSDLFEVYPEEFAELDKKAASCEFRATSLFGGKLNYLIVSTEPSTLNRLELSTSL